jgi:AraC-like DNA-binding protein
MPPRRDAADEEVTMAADPTPPAQRPPARRRIRIERDRVFYCGDLGHPAMHRSGAINLYVSLGAPLRYRLADGDWQQAHNVLVQPWQVHQIVCDERLACDLMIEPDSVDRAGLPGFVRGASGAFDAPDFVERMRAAALGAPLSTRGIDHTCFGETLAPRPLDRRIAQGVQHLKDSAHLPLVADDVATTLGLSASRFLHLFGDETGCSFRDLRAWRRARLLLGVINQPQNLSRLAQATGYPDASHFSHSIRAFFGIAPKDILRGCRRVVIEPDAAPAG